MLGAALAEAGPRRRRARALRHGLCEFGGCQLVVGSAFLLGTFRSACLALVGEAAVDPPSIDYGPPEMVNAQISLLRLRHANQSCAEWPSGEAVQQHLAGQYDTIGPKNSPEPILRDAFGKVAHVNVGLTLVGEGRE